MIYSQYIQDFRIGATTVHLLNRFSAKAICKCFLFKWVVLAPLKAFQVFASLVSVEPKFIIPLSYSNFSLTMQHVAKPFLFYFLASPRPVLSPALQRWKQSRATPSPQLHLPLFSGRSLFYSV